MVFAKGIHGTAGAEAIAFLLVASLLFIAGGVSSWSIGKVFVFGLPARAQAKTFVASTSSGLLLALVGRRSIGSGDSPGRTRAELVDELLLAIAGTDRGVAGDEQQRTKIQDLISKLEAEGTSQDFFADGSVYGNYEVSYVGASSSRIANPAGGRWRGRFGRLLCPTRGLFQHILRGAGEEVIGVNVVQAALLGLLPLAVVLRGSALQTTPEERTDVAAQRCTPGGLSENAAQVSFDAPVVAIGSLTSFIPPLRLQVGPVSSVVLDAPYVDERIRIGKGASGIRFVFRRTEDASAECWRRVIARRPLSGKAVGIAISIVGIIGTARALLASAWLPIVTVWLPATLLGLACTRSSGGIVRRQPRNADYVGQGLSSES